MRRSPTVGLVTRMARQYLRARGPAAATLNPRLLQTQNARLGHLVRLSHPVGSSSTTLFHATACVATPDSVNIMDAVQLLFPLARRSRAHRSPARDTRVTRLVGAATQVDLEGAKPPRQVRPSRSNRAEPGRPHLCRSGTKDLFPRQSLSEATVLLRRICHCRRPPFYLFGHRPCLTRTSQKGSRSGVCFELLDQAGRVHRSLDRPARGHNGKATTPSQRQDVGRNLRRHKGSPLVCDGCGRRAGEWARKSRHIADTDTIAPLYRRLDNLLGFSLACRTLFASYAESPTCPSGVAPSRTCPAGLAGG